MKINNMDLKATGTKVVLDIYNNFVDTDLVIPEKIVDHKSVGTVIDVGDDVTRDINIGDVVIYKTKSGLMINPENQNIKLFDEKDIISKSK